jgi:hypothetical protein
MIVASAKGSFKIAALIDSMKQLYGDRQDIPIESPSFVTAQGESVIIATERIISKRIDGKRKMPKRD